MVTLKTRYSLEQFRRVLQPVAHNVALQAVQKLNGAVWVKALDGKIIDIRSNDFAIHYKRGLMLQIEEHPYTDGNLTKIVVQGEGKRLRSWLRTS
jgi:hypothetical protein